MEPTDMQIGFVGAGNMAEALMGAVINTGVCRPGQIMASDISEERLLHLQDRYGITTTKNNGDVFNTSDLVVLAVKPQQMEGVLESLASSGFYPGAGRRIVVSIAAGYLLERMEAHLYAPLDISAQGRMPLVRVMPNTPALVGQGMAGIALNRNATSEDTDKVRSILEATGQVRVVPEELMDAVTAVSGSGPAYVFYLAQAMEQGGTAVGLPPEDARALVLQTLRGAVALLEETGESPEELRRKVTSPGGTTEAALKRMDKGGVLDSVVEGIRAAAMRSFELSGKTG